MRLELNTNGAWRVVLRGLHTSTPAGVTALREAKCAAATLADLSNPDRAQRAGITWRLVSEADGSVVELCGDDGWRPAYRPGAKA